MHLTEQEQRARNKVCLPLDGISYLRKGDAPKGETSIESRVEELSPVVGLFKIGKESYTSFGPDAVHLVNDFGANVFLDLKYHDIPNTVRGAARAASELGVYMFNVHASGGSAMMEAAVQGARDVCENYTMPKIVGVTVLTSIDDATMNNEMHVPGAVADQVRHYAELVDESGLDGIVCSAADLYNVRDHLRDDFMYVTPGIKGPNTPAGSDQKRVFTPGNAVQDGSSILVIGRAITGADTPEGRLQAGYEVLQDMAPYV